MSYLQSLYAATNGEGYLTVWNKRTKATERYPSTSEGIEHAKAHMLSVSRADDVYFGWCLQAEPSGAGRGAASTAVFSPGIMFDADLFSETPGVHAQAALPKCLADVRGWLSEADIPEPTAIRSSGNGLYLDWLHDEPVFLRSPQEREDYAALVESFHRKLMASALSLRGWRFDYTGDLARVTRMPGTWNHKTNPAKPVEVIQ